MRRHFLYLIFLAALFNGCKEKPHYATYDEYPVYEGTDLELTYSPHSCKFRVWAPTATKVKVLLYDNGYEGGAYQTHDMKQAEQGTWTLEIDENLKGKFYTFQIKTDDRWMPETPGMWVKATGLNGKRAAIIDMTETDPQGWENDVRPPFKNFTDIILYEVHVRDFSASPSSGMKNKGKFLAFTERGSKNTAGEATGIDHLRELGITHVHLLPPFDFASIDETRPKENNYSLGFDPLNFNVPEGSYSTNPKDPVVRIREFKQMVQSLHKAGIRVVMDVAYNHTSKGKNSSFDLLAPGYFYRINADSTLSNATGYGNEIATERGMMRKFIVESVLYWATEYHLDGFRFDQMGSYDIQTMNEVRAALDKIDPTIFVFGDGTTVAASPLAEEKRAVTKNTRHLDNIAVYNDELYQILTGNLIQPSVPGFVSGIDSLEENIRFGVVGAIKHPQVNYARLLYSKVPYALNPLQSVNYASNRNTKCLSDRLLESKQDGVTDAELLAFNKLAQTIVFTSQGVPSIYAGEEFGRSRNGFLNTSLMPDSLNMINWNLKTANKDMLDYFRNLIALRKSHSALRVQNSEMVQSHLKFLNQTTPNVVGLVLTDHVNDEDWRDIVVLYNANRKAVRATIPAGQWNVVCHNGIINLNGISQTYGDSAFVVAPSSASILFNQ